MAWTFKGLKDKVPEIFKKRLDLQTKNDIQRENIELEKNEEHSAFRFGSIAEHIKKSWVDIKTLNKKV
jgi:hypothetical protein